MPASSVTYTVKANGDTEVGVTSHEGEGSGVIIILRGISSQCQLQQACASIKTILSSLPSQVETDKACVDL